MALSKPRFGDKDSGTFLKDNLDSQSTKSATKFALKLFKEFSSTRATGPATGTANFADLSASELNKLLGDFYTNVRTEKGDFYSKNSLLAIRHSIARHLIELGTSRDILKGESFSSFCQQNDLFL